MEIDAPIKTSSPKCTNDTPDVVITALPAIPLVVIQPLPHSSPEPVLAPLPEDGGAKRKIPRKTQISSSSSTSSISHRYSSILCTTTEMFLLPTHYSLFPEYVFTIILFDRKWSTCLTLTSSMTSSSNVSNVSFWGRSIPKHTRSHSKDTITTPSDSEEEIKEVGSKEGCTKV